VPMEVSRMIREAEEQRSGFVLYPRFEIDELEIGTDPHGPNDRLLLPPPPQVFSTTPRIAAASSSGTSSCRKCPAWGSTT